VYETSSSLLCVVFFFFNISRPSCVRYFEASDLSADMSADSQTEAPQTAPTVQLKAPQEASQEMQTETYQETQTAEFQEMQLDASHAICTTTTTETQVQTEVQTESQIEVQTESQTEVQTEVKTKVQPKPTQKKPAQVQRPRRPRHTESGNDTGTIAKRRQKRTQPKHNNEMDEDKTQIRVGNGNGTKAMSCKDVGSIGSQANVEAQDTTKDSGKRRRKPALSQQNSGNSAQGIGNSAQGIGNSARGICKTGSKTSSNTSGKPPLAPATLPKRNMQADVDVARLGLHQMGPFWISRNGKSPCFVTRVQQSILSRILFFFSDDRTLLHFLKWRSEASSDGVSLRVVDYFYTNWCKANPVFVATASGQSIVDVKEAYRAMLAQHTKLNFDPFNRGPTGILFETPTIIASKKASTEASTEANTEASTPPIIASKEASQEARLPALAVDPVQVQVQAQVQMLASDQVQASDRVQVPANQTVVQSDVRRVNATTVGQLHFFYWMMNTKHYDLIASRCREIHKSMRASIRRNRLAKLGDDELGDDDEMGQGERQDELGQGEGQGMLEQQEHGDQGLDEQQEHAKQEHAQQGHAKQGHAQQGHAKLRSTVQGPRLAARVQGLAARVQGLEQRVQGQKRQPQKRGHEGSVRRKRHELSREHSVPHVLAWPGIH
jgi:hypothetical protein